MADIEPSSYKCTNCSDQLLETITLPSGRLERCPACHWFLSSRELLFDYSDDKEACRTALGETRMLRLPSSRQCPRCVDFLWDGRVRSRSVNLMECPSCQALWMDFATLARFEEPIEVRLRGAIERLLFPIEGTPQGLSAEVAAQAFPRSPAKVVEMAPPPVPDKGLARLVRSMALTLHTWANRMSENKSVQPAAKKTPSAPKVVTPQPIVKAPVGGVAEPPKAVPVSAPAEVAPPPIPQPATVKAADAPAPALAPPDPPEPLVTPGPIPEKVTETAPAPPPVSEPIPEPSTQAPILPTEEKPTESTPLVEVPAEKPELSPRPSSKPPEPPQAEPLLPDVVEELNALAPAPEQPKVPAVEAACPKEPATVPQAPFEMVPINQMPEALPPAEPRESSPPVPTGVPAVEAPKETAPVLAPPPAPPAPLPQPPATLRPIPEAVVKGPAPFKKATAPKISPLRKAKPANAKAPVMVRMLRWLTWAAPLLAVLANFFSEEGFDAGVAAEWAAGAWGLARLVQLFFVYPWKPFDETTLADLPVAPLPDSLSGRAVVVKGKVVQDPERPKGTLLVEGERKIPLDQFRAVEWLPRVFGVAGLTRRLDQLVAVKGWYRAAAVPFIEVSEISSDTKSQRALTKPVRWVSTVAVLILVAIILFTSD